MLTIRTHEFADPLGNRKEQIDTADCAMLYEGELVLFRDSVPGPVCRITRGTAFVKNAAGIQIHYFDLDSEPRRLERIAAADKRREAKASAENKSIRGVQI